MDSLNILLEGFIVDSPLLALIAYLSWQRDKQMQSVLDIIREQDDRIHELKSKDSER